MQIRETSRKTDQGVPLSDKRSSRGLVRLRAVSQPVFWAEQDVGVRAGNIRGTIEIARNVSVFSHSHFNFNSDSDSARIFATNLSAPRTLKVKRGY